MRDYLTVSVFVLIALLLLPTFFAISRVLARNAGTYGVMSVGVSLIGIPPNSPYPPPALDWAFPYGGTIAEEAHSVQRTADRGFIVAGYTNVFPLDEQIWLVKIDENGTAQWSQMYGGDKSDRAYSVQQTKDGGYIIAGDTNSFGSGSYDAYLIKTYANGGVEWSQTYGGAGADYAWSVQQTNDTGYVVAGATGIATDFWLLKTDGAGDLEWSQTYGSFDADEAYSVHQTSDRGFIVAGTVYHDTEYQGMLLKTDSNGTEQWSHEYGGGGDFDDDYLWSVEESIDGSYIAAGHTHSLGSDSVDFWLIKTDSNGNEQWSKIYGGMGDDYAKSVIQTNDTGYVLAGYTDSFGEGDFDAYVVKTYSDGEMQWSQNYGGEKADLGFCVCEAKDQGYVVAGYTMSIGAGSSDFSVLKITPEDADRDSLYDSWEQKGIDYNGDGSIDLNLADLGANWMHKDVFVEVDYMTFHEPDETAITNVISAFKNAPVKNPDNKEGINLHIEIDDVIEFNETTAEDESDRIKNDHFGNYTQRSDSNSVNILAAKKLAYRYALFVNKQAGDEGSSGNAELQGNDFEISLGSFTNGKGTPAEQGGTFMHELGHTLGLLDGGGDNINFKPNYLSVMNYAFQFPGFYSERPLDYSRTQLPDLDEGNLSEPAGVGAGPFDWTVYSMQDGNPVVSNAMLPIDWNENRQTTDMNVQANINNFSRLDIIYDSPPFELLHGFDDWQNLKFNFRESPDFADGIHTNLAAKEITWMTVESIRNVVKSMHDVAIIKVRPSQPIILQGSTLNVNVTLMNQGGNNETFRVTVYADATSIVSQELTLGKGNITAMTLVGETASLSERDYTLRAYATPLTNETDVADNNYTYGIFTVTNKSMGWVEWSQSWTDNIDYHERAYSVCQTLDGGFALAGTTGGNYGDFWLIKTYADGSEQWSRTYGYGSYYEEGAHSVEQTNDGGYILAGYTHPPQGFTSLLLIKTDSEGNMLWNKTYGGDSNNMREPQWVALQTMDGGYIAAGSRRSYPEETYDMWIIRTDSEGNELWNKTYGGANWEYAYSVWQTTDGGYVLGGYTDSLDPEAAAWLVKTDSLGNEQWNRTYTHGRLYSLQQTKDGGYILTGAMYYYGQNDLSDFWLLKADSNGNTQWNKTYDCTQWINITDTVEEAYCVRQTTDGGYVLVGKTESYGESYAEVWIVKTDPDGNMETDLVFGKNPDCTDIAYSVLETRDGSYIAAGCTQLNEHPYTNHLLLLKFNLLVVIPEFTPYLMLPILIITALAAIAVSRKRRAPLCNTRA